MAELFKRFKRMIIVFVAAKILLVSLVGITISSWNTKNASEAIINYEGKGAISMHAYNRPKLSGGNIFLPITNSVEMYFKYKSTDNLGVNASITATIFEQRNRWNKNVDLNVLSLPASEEGGSGSVFTLDLKSIVNKIRTIERDIDPSIEPTRKDEIRPIGTYLIKITATVSGKKAVSVWGKINDQALEWESPFNGAYRNENGSWEAYAFGYDAKLLPNELYKTDLIRVQPKITVPVLADDEAPITISGSESIDIVLNTSLLSKEGVNNVETIGTMELQVKTEKFFKTFYKKDFRSSEREIVFPLDLDSLKEMIDEQDGLVDGKSSQSIELILKPLVSIYGTIGKTSVPVKIDLKAGDDGIKGRIDSDRIIFGKTDSLVGKGNVILPKEKKESGSTMPIWYLLLGISGTILLKVIWEWRKTIPKPTFIETEQGLRAKYVRQYNGGLQFAEAVDLFDESGSKMIGMKSLEALIGVSGGVVLFNQADEEVTYWATEEDKIYVYHSKKQ